LDLVHFFHELVHVVVHVFDLIKVYLFLFHLERSRRGLHGRNGHLLVLHHVQRELHGVHVERLGLHLVPLLLVHLLLLESLQCALLDGSKRRSLRLLHLVFVTPQLPLELGDLLIKAAHRGVDAPRRVAQGWRRRDDFWLAEDAVHVGNRI